VERMTLRGKMQYARYVPQESLTVLLLVLR